jgi:competence protein ComEA
MNRLALALVTFVFLSAGVVPGFAQDKPAKAAPAIATVNLNSATSVQLEALPGVGAKAAQRIIEYRQKNGAFKKIEELMNVKGFGEKSFLKLKPYLTVGATAAPAPTR